MPSQNCNHYCELSVRRIGPDFISLFLGLMYYVIVITLLVFLRVSLAMPQPRIGIITSGLNNEFSPINDIYMNMGLHGGTKAPAVCGLKKILYCSGLESNSVPSSKSNHLY